MAAPVLIAGGGPVGMTCALALAQHGVPVALFERNPETTRHPKMDITNGRSLELFRRLGVAERLRAVAVPPDHPLDVSWVTSMAGHELHRFPYAAPNEQRAAFAAANDGRQPLEPAMRVSQVVIEPVLKAAVLAEPLIASHWGAAVEDVAQDAAGVTLTVRDRASDAVRQVRGRYLVGCDGGGSAVRRALGLAVEGQHAVANRFMIHFRSRARAVLQRFGIAWHYQSPRGTLIAQDDDAVYTLHARFPDGTDTAHVDPLPTLFAALGTEIDAEILVANPWTPHLLLAERYREGRVFLAGDAAHQYIPTGGYGMNTGIGDAIAIAWMLAGAVQGWGGPALLDAYDAERRPIGRINRDWSERHTGVRLDIASAYAAHPDADRDPAERQALANAIAAAGNLENEAFGLEFAYRYDASPLVAPLLEREPGPAPPADVRAIPAMAWPGMRAPHLFDDAGRAIFDRLAVNGLTLLRFNGRGDPAPVRDAARRLGVPLHLVEVQSERARQVYGADLALIRPDQHLAWRGNEADGQALAIACGRAPNGGTEGAPNA
ncbi:MAG: FAD-dependent monooxygenase [Alphaproteobacteria bacterium]|nr:FAD-dependent monooxygenase [Alphaproteobacteria bacterium]MCB9930207.1 FAD-dependent monooxygenase [Alphaproteobacteria bacterium]